MEVRDGVERSPPSSLLSAAILGFICGHLRFHRFASASAPLITTPGK